MFDIEIDISELEAAWQNSVQSLHAGAATSVREACKEGAQAAVDGHLYEDRTTQLTASIHGDGAVILTANGAEGSITAGEDYASYVEAWEREQREFSFMQVAENKATEVLQREMEASVARAESAANR